MKRLTPAEAIVLQAIGKGYRHGFDVIESTGLAGGTVYPILRRMEAAKLVSSSWERAAIARQQGRPPRRYYLLTREGNAALEGALERFLFLRPFAAQLEAKP